MRVLVGHPACSPPAPELDGAGVSDEDCSEVEALPDVRGADARSAQIGNPDGVTRSFQVSVNSVEPREAILARNLFAKNDWRSALGDELEPIGPEVPIVVEPGAVARLRERLARARPRPDVGVIVESGEPAREAPSTDAGEEMALSAAVDVGSAEGSDGPSVDRATRDLLSIDEVLQPLGSEPVDLVVDGDHEFTLPR
jgi:hypothetical protein